MAIVQLKTRIRANVGTLRQKLAAAGLPTDVVDSVTSAFYAGELMRDGSARAYAAHFEQAFDEYGIDGLKMQVLYFVSNAREWQGDQAKIHKARLKKWANSRT